MTPTEACRVLGVDKRTPPGLVRRAWLRKVRETHPDGEGVTSAEEFHAVQSAYEVLTAAGRGVGPPPPRAHFGDAPASDPDRAAATVDVLNVLDGMNSTSRSDAGALRQVVGPEPPASANHDDPAPTDPTAHHDTAPPTTETTAVEDVDEPTPLTAADVVVGGAALLLTVVMLAVRRYAVGRDLVDAMSIHTEFAAVAGVALVAVVAVTRLRSTFARIVVVLLAIAIAVTGTSLSSLAGPALAVAAMALAAVRDSERSVR